MTIEDKRLAGVNALSLSNDGRRLLTGTNQLTFCVWNAETGNHLTTLAEGLGEPKWQAIVALSPNGKLAALAHKGSGNAADPGVSLVDAETGKVLFSLEGHTRGIRLLCFNADGSRLASAGDDETIRLWDTSTGQEVLSRLAPPDVVDLDFTRDGRKLIAVDAKNGARAWQAGS